MKRFLLLLTIFTSLSMFSGEKVYASEVNEIPKLAWDVGQTTTCRLNFTVIDETGNFSADKLVVHMNDVTGVSNVDFDLQRAASWGNSDGYIPLIDIPAPTTYFLSVDGLTEGYKLVNTIGRDPIATDFAATSNGTVDFMWSIVSENNSSFESETAKVENNNDVSEGSNNINDNEASKVYREFLDKVSFIENDKTWEDFLISYTVLVNQDSLEEMYARTVNLDDGKTEDERKKEFRDMSSYERFLWIETYCRIANQIKSGYASDVNTKDEFWRIVDYVSSLASVVEPNNYEQVVKAYNHLMEWQFAYIQEHNYPFNFIQNKSYLEEVGGKEEKTITETVEETDEAGLSTSDKKEMEEAKKELLKESEQEEKKGIWSDTIEILTKNIFSFVIMIILLIALGVVVYFRTKNNYTEDAREESNE